MPGSVHQLVQLIGTSSASVLVVMVIVFGLASGWVIHEEEGATAGEPHVPVNDSGVRQQTVAPFSKNSQPLLAGDAPAFLLASVQPIEAPESWRRMYHEVEQCAGRRGDYDAIRWRVMEAPLQGPKGPTYAFTVSSWCEATRPISGTRCCTTSWKSRDGSRGRLSPASTTPSPTCIRCRSSVSALGATDHRRARPLRGIGRRTH